MEIKSSTTYIGHSTMLIEMDGMRILTDPVFRNRVTILQRTWPTVPSTLYENIDAVLISHLHYDHLDFASLRLLEGSYSLIVPHGAAPIMKKNGIREFHEVSVNETFQINSIKISTTFADHNRSRLFFGPYADPIGYMINGSSKIYFPGDTRFFPEFSDLCGDIDLALMPVWGWGPDRGSTHMSPLEAAQALNLLKPRMAVPIHWGTYIPWGLHWMNWNFHTMPPLVFEAHAKKIAPQVKVQILKPGENIPAL